MEIPMNAERYETGDIYINTEWFLINRPARYSAFSNSINKSD